MTKIEKTTGTDGTPCLMVGDRYCIYLDTGVVYDTDAAEDIPQYVFALRDAAVFAASMERERWIPCKERLPEGEADVLVYCEDGYIAIVPYSPKHKQFNNFDKLERDRETAFDNVAYWRPIPEPPKEAGDR